MSTASTTRKSLWKSLWKVPINVILDPSSFIPVTFRKLGATETFFNALRQYHLKASWSAVISYVAECARIVLDNLCHLA
jgi:hypothetical protein